MSARAAARTSGGQDLVGWLWGKLDVLLEALRRALVPQETAAARTASAQAVDQLFVYGAMTFGDVVLAARDRAELDQALDEVVWDREFLRFVDYVRPLVHQTDGNRPTERAIHALTQGIGAGFELKVREFARLVQISIAAMEALPRDLPVPKRMPVAMADRLFDLATPPAYIECVVGELRADAAQLAILQGASTKRLELWQAHSLIEFSCEGVRRHLRLIAEFGNVPEDVVPLDERISWRDVVRDWDRLVERLDEINAAADASGASVYPVFGARPDAD